MPYMIKKRGDKYCVVKKEGKSRKAIKGACHSTRSEAIKQMQAIQISEHGG